MRIKKYSIALFLAAVALSVTALPSGMVSALSPMAQQDTLLSEAINPASVVDEVVWVVGDEPILKSEVEMMRLQGEAEGVKWKGDPECKILEQIAVQKLFLHQAALDSIKVTEGEIAQGVDQPL